MLFAAGAGAISLLTPIVRATPQLAWLPDPIEWYFRPSPGRTNFTLFPWAGFRVRGRGRGGRPRRPEDRRNRRQGLQMTLAVAGALVVWLAHEASFRPPSTRDSDYWTTSPRSFFLRVGLLTLLLPLGYAWEHVPLRHKLSSWSPLEELGRASLFVYWIHVEMVYGFFSRPIRRVAEPRRGAGGLCALHGVPAGPGAAEELARGGEGHLSN